METEEDRKRREVKSLKALYLISSLTRTAEPIEDKIRKALLTVQKTILCHSGSIFLLNRETSKLEESATVGTRVELIESMKFDLGSGLSAWVAENRNSVLLSNLRLDDFRSFVSTPLIAGDELVGVMNLAHDEPYHFNEDNLDFLEIIAGQLADTIDRSRFLKQLVKKNEALEEARQKIQNDMKNIEEKNIQLEELDSIKNKFLGMAAHDLRNPLTSIGGFCDILLEEDNISDEEQKEIINIINDASGQMLNLVNDLLDVTAIESGRMAIHFEKGSIRKVLEEKIKMSEIIASHKKITIKTSFKNVPDIVFDKNRIMQAIDNLIGNAIKFSHKGSSICVSLKNTENNVVFSVCDEGPGISEADQKKLFVEFQPLSSKPTGEEKSTGLGLVITKKIIDAHKGKIKVKSTPGKGATFTVLLPLEHKVIKNP